MHGARVTPGNGQSDHGTLLERSETMIAHIDEFPLGPQYLERIVLDIGEALAVRRILLS
jgi:hypothetical protein